MIRPALIAWRDVTEKLLAMTRNNSEEQREETINNMEKYLDDRDKLQSHISPPFSPEEDAYGKELIALESDVQKKLELFRKQIRSAISETQSKKGTVKNYINPYSKVARDGTFYDTKQ